MACGPAPALAGAGESLPVASLVGRLTTAHSLLSLQRQETPLGYRNPLRVLHYERMVLPPLYTSVSFCSLP